MDMNAQSSLQPGDMHVPSKKKNLLWLWVSVPVLVVIGIGVGATYLFVKNAAEQTAAAYTVSLKSYLDDVHDTATITAKDPDTVVRSIQAIDAPVLQPALLGTMFTSYVTASKRAKESTEKVSVLTAEITTYAQFYVFHTNYLSLYGDLQAHDSEAAAALASNDDTRIKTYFATYYAAIKDIEALTKTALVAGDQQANVTDLGNVYQTLDRDWAALISTYDAGDSNGYRTAFNTYIADADEVATAEKPLQDYFNSLTAKTNDAAKRLQIYSDSIN
jgi:hypothetical protein